MPSISLIIPSYRRHEVLRSCLEAVEELLPAPDEVVVVARVGDDETARVATLFGFVMLAEVSTPGVLAALQVGADRATGHILAFTDDDARPRPEWLGVLSTHFDDPRVGGVGGRDVIWTNGQPDFSVGVERVGQITWAGRIIGNHHRGRGAVRTVDVIKGVNMAYRREAFKLPRGLFGSGAQAHFEVAVARRAQRDGWLIRYDPSALVDHFPAERVDDDRRGRPSWRAQFNRAYNSSMVCAVGCGWRILPITLRSVLIGEKPTPGFIRWAAGVAAVAPRSPGFSAAVAGRLMAFFSISTGQGLRF